MNQSSDHFKIDADGVAYAGDHLLIEMWGAKNLTDAHNIRKTMEASAAAAGANLLHSHYHSFGQGGGISGVSVLAESHLTIHTWPELNYAAIDIFMCGACDPNDSMDELIRGFAPSHYETRLLERGRLPDSQALAQA